MQEKRHENNDPPCRAQDRLKAQGKHSFRSTAACRGNNRATKEKNCPVAKKPPMPRKTKPAARAAETILSAGLRLYRVP
jgi:hypothetical protein